MGDQEVESFSGSHADLESAADHLFTSPPRPQPLAFEALSLKTPAKSVPLTPGTALQQKIESKFEQSLGSHLDIQLEQKMGIFQANMLEAMKFIQEDFQKFTQKTSSQVEVDQTSASASKPGPSNTVHLDPSPRPRPLSHSVESMEVDYGPAPPPHLGVDPPRRVDDASGLHLHAVEEPSRLPSTRVKKHSHSQRQHDIDRALPRTNTQIRPMTLGLLQVDLKSILTKQNTNPGPDIYLLPQRRTP